MPATNDLLVPTRKLEESCARCHHTAGQHHHGAVRSWEYCLSPGCRCPGWCSTVECATCDHGTPRWAGYAQCLACLDYRVKPSDYVYRPVVGFDAETARVAIQGYRQEWEVKHPGWRLELDRQRLWPESAVPSKYSDRHTTLGRKKYDARFRVVRAHPRRRSVSQISRRALSYADLRDTFDTHARMATYLAGKGPYHISGGRSIETPIVFAKHDPREEMSPGVYSTPLDWKSYSVSIPIEGKLSEEVLKAFEESQKREIEHLRNLLTADIFTDGCEVVRLGEERFDATCDHCGGFWDGLFPSQEAADQWLVQHRAVCLPLPPPPLIGGR